MNGVDCMDMVNRTKNSHSGGLKATTRFHVLRWLSVVLGLVLSPSAFAVPTVGAWSPDIPVGDAPPDRYDYTFEFRVPEGIHSVQFLLYWGERGVKWSDAVSDDAVFYVDDLWQGEEACQAPGDSDGVDAEFWVHNLTGQGATIAARVWACITSRNLGKRTSTFRYKYFMYDDEGEIIAPPSWCKEGMEGFPDCNVPIACGGTNKPECCGKPNEPLCDNVLRQIYRMLKRLNTHVNEYGDKYGRHVEKVWKELFGEHWNGFHQWELVTWVDQWSAPGSVPVVKRPAWGSRSGPFTIDAPVYPPEFSDTVDFQVGCTAGHGCDDYQWFLEYFDASGNWLPATVGSFENGQFGTSDAFTRMTGFAWDGKLYRVKVWQSVEDREGWTVEHDDWKYFFNGIPDEPPSPPILLSPDNGEITPGDGKGVNSNWVHFQVMSLPNEMMHPNFRYRVEILKADSDGSIPGEEAYLPGQNYWPLDLGRPKTRGNVPPTGYNEEAFILPNETATYYWRALATYADDFVGEPDRVAASELRPFNTTELKNVGTSRLSLFGHSVAISEHVAVIGAPWTTAGLLTQAGEVAISERANGTWTRLQSIQGFAQDDLFGFAVALLEGRLAIGAPGAGIAGRVHIYERSDLGWSGPETVAADNGETPDAGFGMSIALDGNTLAVGAPGGNGGMGDVYVFTFESGTWVRQAVIVARDGGTPDGQIGDAFGGALALSGGTLAVGASGRASGDGEIYLYSRQGANWVQVAKLLSPAPGEGAHFGYAIDILGNRLAASAPGALPNDLLYESLPKSASSLPPSKAAQDGTVYLFENQDGSWQQIEELAANVPEAGSLFGFDLAQSENMLLAGAPGSAGSGPPDSKEGSVPLLVQVQEETGPVWQQLTSLTDANVNGPGHGQRGALFGYSIAMWDDSAIIGSVFDSYVYEGIPGLQEEDRFPITNTGFNDDSPADTAGWHCSGGTIGACGGRYLATGGAVLAHTNVPLPAYLAALVDAGGLSARFGGKATQWATNGRCAFVLDFYDGMPPTDDCDDSTPPGTGLFIGSERSEFWVWSGQCDTIAPKNVAVPPGTRVIQFRLENPGGVDWLADDIYLELVQADYRGSVSFITTDTDPPVVTIVAPDTPFLTNGDEITFTVIFNEPVQNVDETNFLLTQEGFVSYTGPLIWAEDESRVWKVKLDNVSGDGILSLSVDSSEPWSVIEDLAGNPLLATAVGSVIVDNTAPEFQDIAIEPPQPSVGDTIAIAFESSEYLAIHPVVTVGSDEAELTFLENQEVIDNTQRVRYICSWTLNKVNKEATLPIVISATDGAGNTGMASTSVDVFVDEGEGEGEGEGASSFHSADRDGNNAINLSELLRVIQFYNSDGFGCQPGTEDGFAPNDPDQGCAPHASDYNPQDWEIGLSELLRLIQFYNSNGFVVCPEGEDGFCPV